MKLDHLPPVEPPEIIRDLVERYRTHRDSYLDPKYNEANLRQQFINPFFKALGWDVYNDRGDAEAYKDVVHEDQVRVGGTTKAPDYSFRYGGVRKFFVEAKKPSVDIENNPEPAYQLRRYAWSAKLPLSILTNFETFTVYDCRQRPDPTHKALTARVMLFHFEDYLIPEKWGQIAGVFQRDRIPKGAFEAFAESNRLKKGTAAVDQEFLKEIESWRDLLSHNIALRNPGLSQRELNISVQTTIDRIVFLRICEDRGIEPANTLKDIGEKSQVYHHLFERFQRADERYNSGLFHFHKETERARPPDTLTPRLVIEDKPLRDILARLYYPDSPYEFSVIPAEILGQVYEQFLGKVIRLTQGHRAVVEEKPEVRKAGGVYYTPSYIVDYIIKETLGALIEGKSPMEVGGLTEAGAPSKSRRPVTVLDPACGSGSFLLEAYQFLLDWYLRWYVNDGPEKWTKVKEPKIHPTGVTLARRNGTPPGWRLTTSERKRILLAHIYGVDIDPQAVEVTKLSLLLKVLEGESAETLETQQRLLHERALPDLESNIKCGNSLVGPDYYDDRCQKNLFDEEEIYRINAFDWNLEFGSIMNTGGFDAVVGNPPYLFITEVPKDTRAYFQSHYNSISYRFDLYGAFIEKAAMSLLLQGGRLGYIIPHTLLSNDSFRRLRQILSEETSITKVVDLGPGVFPIVKNETMLLFLRNSPPKGSVWIEVIRSTSQLFPGFTLRFRATQRKWAGKEGAPWLVHVTRSNEIVLQKIRKAGLDLASFCTSNQGLRTGDNARFLSEKRKSTKWLPAVGGKEIARYHQINPSLFVHYIPEELDAPRSPEIFFSEEKIVIQEIRNITLRRRLIATLDTSQMICLQSTNVINKKGECPWSLRYILGFLNSIAANYFFRMSFPGNNHIPSNQILRVPIPEPRNMESHDKMVSLVTHMLSLQQHLESAQTAHERDALKRQIEATDREIDRLVFDLYGLNEEEIRIVEEEG